MPENSRLVARTVTTEETRVGLDCRTEAAALGRMLKNATLFANASTITESGLDVIRLEVRPGELAMFATDRYVLAQETTRLAPHDPATSVQAGAFTLSAGDANTLIKALPAYSLDSGRPHRHRDAPLPGAHRPRRRVAAQRHHAPPTDGEDPPPQ